MNKRCTWLIVSTIVLTTAITYATPIKADIMITNNNQSIQSKLPIAKLKSKEITIKPVTYDPYHLNELSNIRLIDLQRMFKNTTMRGLEESFIIAEKEYGINALFLVGLVANESGWNNSKRAKDGSNNITGHAVYHSASRGSTFNSKADCIYSTAKLIKNGYLNPKGEHYNGYSIWNVNMKYSLLENGNINHQWANDINSIVYNLLNK